MNCNYIYTRMFLYCCFFFMSTWIGCHFKHSRKRFWMQNRIKIMTKQNPVPQLWHYNLLIVYKRQYIILTRFLKRYADFNLVFQCCQFIYSSTLAWSCNFCLGYQCSGKLYFATKYFKIATLKSDNTEHIGQLYEVKIRRKLNIDMSKIEMIA